LVGNGVSSREDKLVSLFSREFFQKVGVSIQIGFLSLAVSSVGALDLGAKRCFSSFVNIASKSSLNWLYLLDVDEVERGAGFYGYDNYDLVVYQGHHGDSLVSCSDIVLPGVSPIEKKGTFADLFGNFKVSPFVVASKGEARLDWKIFSGLLGFLEEGYGFSEAGCAELYLAGFVTFSFSREAPFFPFELSFSNITCANSGTESFVAQPFQVDSITRSSSFLALASARFRKADILWYGSV
jgi:hypothetical protein